MANNPKLFYFFEKQQFDEALNLLSEVKSLCDVVSKVHEILESLVMLSSVYLSPDQVVATSETDQEKNNSNQ